MIKIGLEALELCESKTTFLFTLTLLKMRRPLETFDFFVEGGDDEWMNKIDEGVTRILLLFLPSQICFGQIKKVEHSREA